MNDHKFCFIICANKENYLNECVWYIDKLHLPEGYEKETIVVRDAASMASGYNQAMKQSDAKYKIYLHQDVLIVNTNLFSDLLELFQDPTIGMAGVVGRKELLASAKYTENWDAGAVAACNVSDAFFLSWPFEEGEKWNDVVAVDGMFIATQYDLSWDEEDFDGWDFYDISQSITFQQAGYRIVVPGIEREEDVWIFHDAGHCEYDDWEKYRKVFCEKYASSGHSYTETKPGINRTEREKKRQMVMSAFEAGDLERTCRLLEQLETGETDDIMSYIGLFILIWDGEMTLLGNTSLSVNKFGKFIDQFNEVKFMLRRIYFGWQDEAWPVLREKLRSGQITMRMLWFVMCSSIVGFSRVWWEIYALYQKEIRIFFQEGDILKAENLLQQQDNVHLGKYENIMKVLIQVFRREVEKGVTSTVFDVFQDFDEAVTHFIRLKLYLRRIEFGLPEPYQREAYEYFIQTHVSDYLILQILKANIFYKVDFCNNMAQLFAREEGEGSMRAGLYAQLAELEKSKGEEDE